MTNPSAGAIATLGASGACAVIGWAVPSAAILAVVGVVLSVCYIWRNA